jgi:uncharacterized protein (DUF2225 family)
MAVTVTCPKCRNAVFVEPDVGIEYLREQETECPLCEHVFKMKYVRFFDEQQN